MVLNRNLRVFLLDVGHDATQCVRATDSGHILDTDLIRTQLDQLIRHLGVILHRMHRRVCDTQRALRDHACLFRVLNRGSDIAHIVQATERTCDVRTLRLLHLIEKATYIVRHRTHTQTVQRTIQHVRLDTRLMERLRPLTNRFIGILTE